jgi:hypothetical protein
MTAYATRADVYKYGLPRGMLANPGRLCASALAATDRFELDGHGFATDDEVIFRAEAGGELPSPIVAGTTYYAIRYNEQFFGAALTPAGAAIDLIRNGSAVVVATPLPFDDVLEACSRYVDEFMPANAVPFPLPCPRAVTDIVAELAAARLMTGNGQRSEALDRAEIAAKARLERFAKGIPVRDALASGSTNVAVSESVSNDPRDWGSGGLLP